MRRKLVAALLVIGAGTLSCQVIMGLHDPDGNPAPEAGPPDSGPKDPCTHAAPPPPPLKDDDTTTKNTYWFATRSLNLPLAPDGGHQPGFDLDNACTCEADFHDGGPSCTTPGVTTTGSPPACDYEGGIDDGFGKSILNSGVAAFIDVVGPVNSALAIGARTLLLYLSDYNDKANDSDVSVQFIDSGGLYTSLDCDGVTDAGNPVTFEDPTLQNPQPPGQRRAPLNKGCDRWSPNVATTTGTYPNRVPGTTLAAYVTNYTVVVKFKQLSGDVFGGASTISDGIAVATIRKEGNLHFADGFFSGRVPFQGFVDLIARTPVTDPSSSDGGKIPFCDSPYYSLVNEFACKAIDTMSSPSQDFKNQTCDATSIQFAFSLVEAQVDDAEFTNLTQGINCTGTAPSCGN